MTESQTLPSVRVNGSAKRRVAVLDLNNGVPNLGVRSIVNLAESASSISDFGPVSVEVFDVRGRGELPGKDFDAFISSGGPGSPYDGEGTGWETRYFHWLERTHSRNIATLLVCHSFELMIRFFGLAVVSERRSPSFGIFPVHVTSNGRADEIFRELDDPFYAADFRDWQVVEPDTARFKELDAVVLAREKIRQHVPLERAIMAVRVGSNMLGTQFHPEASPEGMAIHFTEDEKMKHVVENYGNDTLDKMLSLLEEPEALAHTYATVIPRFLNHAFSQA